MTNIEKLINQYRDFSDADKVCAHNEYCDNNNDPDNHIYFMEEFEEILANVEKFDLLRMAFYGDFNPNDDYFAFNGYGNLISFGYAKNLDDYLIDEQTICADAYNYQGLYSTFDFDELEEEEEEE